MSAALHYALLVMGAPYSRQASHSALRFAQALHAHGHHLDSVFFYHDGVLNGSRLLAPPQDEPHLGHAWRSLADSTGARLQVCVAASLRRGIVDDAEARRYGLEGSSLAEGFELTGLGQLLHANATADRLITFA
ncbi:sulfurtransferase complex subunit TusD [Carnimonas nigrificans]|uniref:sulfurtransferase complex subunit TusD n=1 Tax=Carnimonas nigrificans TaxID=64323 RepID=UPI0004702E3B|nr:sulfurtransferase complex subunit TusD [Carnimonas nigrificans]